MDKMAFPTDDKYWSETKSFLEKHMDKSDEMLAPGEFGESFPKVHHYTATTIDKSFFKNMNVQWAVIHKGLVPYIEYSALNRIMNRFIPVYANEVFVIYSKKKNLPLIKPTSLHLKPLYDRVRDIHPTLLVKIKNFLNKLVTVDHKQILNESKFNVIGDLIKSKDGFLWIRRTSSEYNTMNQDEIGINFSHEKHILNYIYGLSGKTKIFIDVGAHVGFFSIRLSDKFKKVYALEPNPSNLQALKINISLNHINNIVVYNKGCWSEAKKDKLYDRGGGSFLKNSLSRSTDDKEHDIELITLDSVTSGINESLVIKIDTEGAELAILRGAEQTLRRDDVSWLIEHHEWVYGDLKGRRQEIIDLMAGYGYKLKDIEDNSKLLFIKNGR